MCGRRSARQRIGLPNLGLPSRLHAIIMSAAQLSIDIYWPTLIGCPHAHVANILHARKAVKQPHSHQPHLVRATGCPFWSIVTTFIASMLPSADSCGPICPPMKISQWAQFFVLAASALDHRVNGKKVSAILLILIIYFQMPDRRRWTTEEQRSFLEIHVPQYLAAQASRTYHKFWPGLYQEWFAKFPEPEPQENDPMESEVEDDAEPDALSESDDNGADAAGVASRKRKRSARSLRAKKLARKVFYLSYATHLSY